MCVSQWGFLLLVPTLYETWNKSTWKTTRLRAWYGKPTSRGGGGGVLTNITSAADGPSPFDGMGTRPIGTRAPWNGEVTAAMNLAD